VFEAFKFWRKIDSAWYNLRVDWGDVPQGLPVELTVEHERYDLKRGPIAPIYKRAANPEALKLRFDTSSKIYSSIYFF